MKIKKIQKLYIAKKKKLNLDNLKTIDIHSGNIRNFSEAERNAFFSYLDKISMHRMADYLNKELRCMQS